MKKRNSESSNNEKPSTNFNKLVEQLHSVLTDLELDQDETQEHREKRQRREKLLLEIKQQLSELSEGP